MTQAGEKVLGLFQDDGERGPSIHTATGGRFYVMDPRPGEVSVFDVSHALANLCRFNGHTRFHYSVAQHSSLVSDFVMAESGSHAMAMLGLLHDAHEAYSGDVTRPLKVALEEAAPGLIAGIEGRIQAAILEWAGLSPMDAEAAASLVKEADNVVLATEKRDVMTRPHAGEWGGDLPSPQPEGIERLTPEIAEAGFLSRFWRLKVKMMEKGERA